MVSDANMQKLFNLYDQDEMVTEARIAIGEAFLAIAKNIGLRKLFLRPDYHAILMKNCLQIVENQESQNQRLIQVSMNAIQILCTVSTVKTNRFYIPGETSVSERLRKSSFDCGTFTMLSYIIKNLKEQAPFTEIRNYVRERVMNWIDLNDLQYHAKVLKLLQQQQ